MRCGSGAGALELGDRDREARMGRPKSWADPLTRKAPSSCRPKWVVQVMCRSCAGMCSDVHVAGGYGGEVRERRWRVVRAG